MESKDENKYPANELIETEDEDSHNDDVLMDEDVSPSIQVSEDQKEISEADPVITSIAVEKHVDNMHTQKNATVYISIQNIQMYSKVCKNIFF